MNAPRLPAALIDLVGVVVLVAVGLVGFAHVYGDPWFLVSGTSGTALGIAVALVTRRIRGGVLGGLVLLAVGYLVLGTTFALSGGHLEGMIPSVDSIRTLALGAVDSWRVVVTADVPMAASGAAALPPFLLCAVAASVAVTLAGSGRIGPAVGTAALPLVGAIALGTDRAVLPITQGVVFAVVAILVVAVRGRSVAGQRFQLVSGDTGGTGAVRRTLTGIGVLAVAGCVAAAALPLAPQVHRANIRDAIQPPIDVADQTTPLALFHRYRQTDRLTPLFTISGVKQGSFIRLAELDTYDGMSLGVTRTGTGSGAFPVSAVADRTDERVDIVGLTGVWVPTGGDGVAGVDGSGRIGVNAATASVVTASGVHKGQTFEVQIGPAPVAAQQAAGVTVQPGTPQTISERLADFVGNARSPMDQLKAMQNHFRQGFYSDGLAGQATSLPGHGSARLSTLLTAKSMVGNDEQYAVAMTLMADQLGYPARVDMGFTATTVTNGVATVHGGDVRAYTEVLVEGRWHRYDPTPPKSRTTTDTAPKPKPKPAPQVQQPPPPLRSAEDSTPDNANHTSAKRPTAAQGPVWLPIALRIGVGGLGVLVVVLGPALVIAAVRAARSRRRRRARAPLDRISGGWQEVVDRAAGFGIRTVRTDTRRERAEFVDGALDIGAVQVAQVADERVFGPVEPTDEDAKRFWAEVDGLVRRLDRSSGRWTRVRARYGLARFGRHRPGAATRKDGR